jgi:hypothetical protein
MGEEALSGVTGRGFSWKRGNRALEEVEKVSEEGEETLLKAFYRPFKDLLKVIYRLFPFFLDP